VIRAYVALGSNLGNPVATVDAAIDAMAALRGSLLKAMSSLYRTAPVGLKHQPDFINAVIALDTRLPARELLDELFRVEGEFGRVRSVRNAPRTLDLDLILYDDLVQDDPELTLPHPRMHERAFVLAPLAEIAPGLIVPGRGPVAQLLERCREQRIHAIRRSAD
jgi:2-amino-4-hydroxy-6-hydroxymethyldihydropteridine diphosphokinase